VTGYWQPYIGYAWVFVLALIFLTYLVLDGLVSGIGMLSLWIREPRLRKEMVESFSGVWHAHQTWLVVFAGLLFGSFPMVFGRMLPFLYLPVFLLIVGIAIRGISLELLELNESPGLWTFLFSLGSIILTFSQALLAVFTLKVIYYYAFFQFPASALPGNVFTLGLTLTLIFSYILFGATYLITKTSGDSESLFYAVARKASSALVVTVACVIVLLGIPRPQHPLILYTAFGIALLLSVILFRCLTHGKKKPLFFLAVFSFISLSFALFSTYPGFIPALSSISLFVSSPRSQYVMLIVFCLILPVIIMYNVFQYRVFLGEARKNAGS
jgi:cytochrome d ubiquinol oxidase subunit II